MGSIVETGLGWTLDEDYLRTVGNTVLCTVSAPGTSVAYQSTTQGERLFEVYTSGGINPVTKYNNELGYFAGLTNVPGWTGAWLGISTISTYACGVVWENRYVNNDSGFTRDGVTYYVNTAYWGQAFRPAGNVPAVDFNGQRFDINSTATQDFIISLLSGSSGSTKDAVKTQGGAGAFAAVTYPHDGANVHVAVGISSIGVPNSAATIAVDGVNGNYNTFVLEDMTFTMFYTDQYTGDLNSNVPTITLDTDISSVPGLYEARLFLAVSNAAQIHVGYLPQDEDPYADGGTSEPGGGDGTFDNTSDQIDDSTMPVFSFAGSGFCRIYNPDLSQLQNLANYLWTDTNFLQTIVNHAKQLLEDPIEAIISLAMLPVAIPQGTSENVKVLFISTGVSMPPATTQYVEVDCGTYTLEEYYGSALDYNPYTQVDLFLPFIGQVSLNTDEVMGHTIGVKYRVDIVSGLCVAKVFVDNDCMYQFSGNCAIFMPLNSADFSSYLSAAITAATALVSAGSGAAAGAAAAGAEAVTEPAVQTGGNLLTSGESLVTPQMALQYRVEESVRPMYSPSGSEGSPSASLGEMERKFINNSAAAVMGSKISFEHASHLAGNSGILGVRRPYLIINRPDMCNPEKYGKYNGRPCMMYLYLGSLSGYTEIQEIQLTGFSATNPELAEISKMLKGGVIF